MNWPPTTMATQHPDNASAPWWSDEPFIPTQDELGELLTLFKDFDIDEYMWDWEGKHVDEGVGEKLYAKAKDFFDQHPLGQDKHLTYRIPAWEDGKMHRTARAYMNVLSLADFARELGLPRPPVTEMFLPMVSQASQPMKAYESFCNVAEFHEKAFSEGKNTHKLERYAVTPLVEDTESMFAIEEILEPYWKSLKEKGAYEEDRGQRIFLARSDPALNAGLVPAVLAIKAALSKAYEVGESLGFAVHPIVGTGSLPFRGSVNPLYTDTFLEQYAGTRTYSIQSAFRYDYERSKVEEALKQIKEVAPTREVVRMPEEDRQQLKELCSNFAQIWKPAIESLADTINLVAGYTPGRRERMLHIGLFGYSRGIGKVKLPRAITFTSSFYSLGVPPELVGTGRGLKIAKEKGQLELIDKYYPALRTDLQHAGKYFNSENLEILARDNETFAAVKEDIEAIEEILEIKLQPEKPHHVIHRNYTSTILHRLQGESGLDEVTSDIVSAAVIRRSLG